MHSIIRSNDWDRFNRDPLTSVLYNLGNFGTGVRRHGPIQGSLAVPAVDIKETAADYQVVADLPGISKENLEVSINEGILSIHVGAREESEEQSAGRVIRKERYQGEIKRYFKLSDAVDDENVQASYKDGVLNITVPKKESAQPRKIKVAVH